LNEQYPHRFVQNGTCRYAPTDPALGFHDAMVLIVVFLQQGGEKGSDARRRPKAAGEA